MSTKYVIMNEYIKFILFYYDYNPTKIWRTEKIS